MSRYAANDQRSTFGTAPEARIEAGLRQHMQHLWLYVSGADVDRPLAYAAAVSGFYQAIAGTPLLWLVMLAPLGFVLVLSFGLERISAGTAILGRWRSSSTS
jgi:FtsH-binding integral membrane protein